MKKKSEGITILNDLPITERQDTTNKVNTLDALMQKYYKKNPKLKRAWQELVKKILYDERK